MQAYFDQQVHIDERKQLPILSELIARYRAEKPFRGLKLAFSHILVRNSLVTAEALFAGGAELVLADAFDSPATEQVKRELDEASVPLFSVAQAARMADIYVDVNAVLGREKPPKIAAEVTRTGIHHYRSIDCVVLSADDCKAKRIEGFFGTGDGFLRAWQQLSPNDEFAGKRMLQFGYGKIGRGVAHRSRKAGIEVVLVEADPRMRERAQSEAFATFAANDEQGLRKQLATTDIVLSVTGIPGMISASYSRELILANYPALVSLGAEDEFGPDYAEQEILGGKAVPLNFHLEEPTLNRYVDAPLAAHVMALEAWALKSDTYSAGIHPFPVEMDQWIIQSWRKYWPDEDLSGIAEEIGL